MAVEVSADEMAFLIEVVVDRAVHGGELLECLHPPKSLHRPFLSSERLVGVFRPVVEPAAHLLTTGATDLLHGGAVGSQTVGDDRLRPAMGLHRFLDEFQRGGLVPGLGDVRFKNLAS